ncbi:MAG: DUF4422 domain-containing protein [Candidatus Methanofastidiosa archaeon]|nr:DUF4422 domain-containing protein [Candidatus Methanofastidiosa archaeon]
MKEYSVKIIIAAHKKYKMPTDIMYIPLQVGAEGKKNDNGNVLDLGYVKDNTGDNISSLNSSFCELTGLYWAWRNLNTDYIGLAHYRRHFSMKNKKGFENVLSYEDLKPYLGRIKVFVPSKRKYYIESLYSHYAHTHYSVHLDETRKIILEKYPAYLNSYDEVIKHNYGYMFNMMIMEYSLLDDYCSWLFDILFELEKRMNMQGLSAFQGRFYGRVSEIIFNVWLDEKIKSAIIKTDEVKEIPCIHMEKINWWKKGTAFLKAKFFGKKYEGSF